MVEFPSLILIPGQPCLRLIVDPLSQPGKMQSGSKNWGVQPNIHLCDVHEDNTDIVGINILGI